MNNITIEIKAPELVEAIKALVSALSENPLQQTIITHEQPMQAAPIIQAPTVAAPVMPPVQVTPVQASAGTQVQPAINMAYPAQGEPIPLHNPVTNAPYPQPAQQAPVAPPPTYTIADLQKACAPLMDAGKQQELVSLIQSFGVQALTQIPQERYGEFAIALRGLGAQL